MPELRSPQKYEPLSGNDEDEGSLDWGGRLHSTGLCSRLFFHWITPLIRLGKERQISLADLPGIEAG
eukprot:SAG31_NODE_15262_length_763_cov_1.224398_1_plen_66_part_10